MKKILYIDMDNVLVDFPSGITKIEAHVLEAHDNFPDLVPGIFSLMDPLEEAIESYHLLSEYFETFILSTAPWDNPSAWTDKRLWVQKHLGEKAPKRLILSHRKDLNMGDYLIDDRTKNGAGEFKGELILFGSDEFKDWKMVREYLLGK